MATTNRDASTLLCVDGNVLGRQAFNGSVGKLRNGVIYGMMLQLRALDKRGCRMAVCFDSRGNKRNNVDAKYKRNRREGMSDETKHELVDFWRQMETAIQCCRDVGFNVLKYEGYEADDLIAYVCEIADGVAGVDHVEIVSTDKDLYQLLSGQRVVMVSPKTKAEYTELDFILEYDLTPSMWPMLKAVMGDKGDNVIGVEGVGLKTATRYLSGDKISSTLNARIDTAIQEGQIEMNLKLVKLPFHSLDQCCNDMFVELRKSCSERQVIDVEKWNLMCMMQQLPSLRIKS